MKNQIFVAPIALALSFFASSYCNGQESNDTSIVPEQTPTATSIEPSTTYAASGYIIGEGVIDRVVVMYIGHNTIYANSVAKAMDTAAVIRHDRTFVPARYLIEAMGGKSYWSNETGTATFTLGNNSVSLYPRIESPCALVNGQYKNIDPNNDSVAPYIDENNRTMAPVRFLAESFGFEVAWKASNQQVTLFKTGKGVSSNGIHTYLPHYVCKALIDYKVDILGQGSDLQFALTLAGKILGLVAPHPAVKALAVVIQALAKAAYVIDTISEYDKAAPGYPQYGTGVYFNLGIPPSFSTAVND